MTRVDLQIAERVLDNGLTLLAVRNPGVATFAAALVLEVDVRVEGKGEQGLANLTGDCLEEGTRRRSGLELARAIDELGGALEGNGSGGSVQCPAEASPQALRLLAEMVMQPSFPAREVARVRAEILTEMQAERDDPRVVASQRFRKEVYGAHPFARPLKGSRKTLRAFGPKDLRRFHRKWFVPRGGYVAAAGPAEVGQTLALLERTFAAMDGAGAQRTPPRPPALPDERRDVHLPMQREQVHVFLGHPGVRRTHPDFHALSVMDHVLGSGPGFTSRIAKRLRDEQGLCYSVHASITSTAGEEPGCLTAYIGTSPANRVKAIDGFLEEIERVRREPPSEQELRDVQEYLTGSFVFGLERNSNLVLYAIRAKRFGLGFDYVHRYPGLIRAVTREEVQRVAREHLHPERIVVVSAGAGTGAD